MNVGTICWATESGLGRLAKSFFDHGLVTHFLYKSHPHYANHPEWYPEDCRFTAAQADEFLRDLDVLFLFEQLFDEPIVKQARQRGIRIVLMPMYEYTPTRLSLTVDKYICPSLLDLKYYEHRNACFLPVPVDIPWRQRTHAKVFVHNAGHGGWNFRNGTPEILKAITEIQSPIELIVRGQPDKGMQQLFDTFPGDPRVTLVLDDVPAEQLWQRGDVFLFPERFNGLSLPLQEARAAGMLVMATNRFPMNTWLPVKPLLFVSGLKKMRISRQLPEFASAVVSPSDIAKQVDAWYDADITEYSQDGQKWAQETSWEVLLPRYRAALAS